jgi:hypothetical protein
LKLKAILQKKDWFIIFIFRFVHVENFVDCANWLDILFVIDYINEVLHEGNEDNEVPQISPANDDWDSGLTFTAKATG